MLLAVQKSDPPDPAVLTALGFLAPSMGMTAAQSADYYREALKLDPLNLLAAKISPPCWLDPANERSGSSLAERV